MSQTIEAPKPLSVPESDDFLSLRRLLIRARGFSLALVACNVPFERDRFVERLRASVATDGVDLVVLRFRKTIDDLYEVLADLSLSRGQAVAVLGLEHSIPVGSYFPPILERLNLKRELFRDLAGPVVIFLPDYALTQLAREAPDFWAWRTVVFEIGEAQQPENLVQQGPMEIDLFGYANLSADRKRGHLEVLCELLADLEMREGTEAERSDLCVRISYILLLLGEVDEGHRRAEEALRLARAAVDEGLRLRALDRVADVFELKGDLDKALRIRQEEVLPEYEKLGDVRSRAITLGKVADIYHSRGDFDKALRIRLEEELPVYEKLKDMRESAVVQGKIADIYRSRGDLDKALRVLQEKALPALENLDDVRGFAITLGKIADVYRSQDLLDESLRILQEQALPALEEVGDERSRAITLGKIADIYQSRGDLDEALRIRQEEELPVYEKLGDVRARAATLGKIADIFLLRGDLDEAARINKDESLPLLDSLDDRHALVVRRTNLATTLLRRNRAGDREQAIEQFNLALAFAELMRIPEAEQIRTVLKALGAARAATDHVQ